PQTARTFEVAREYRFLKGSGIPLRIPVIEMVEVGAGGGSIAGVDSMRRISVGPGSAGSNPGPVCYGLGGQLPTVTDADVTLGRIDPNNFAGGSMRLDSESAADALIRSVGDLLGFSVEHAALGVSEIVDENMANAARVHAIESGKNVDARTLVAFGGAAPIHVSRLAEKLGVDRVVIPPGAGVGSALGFLRAPVAYEVIRSHYQQLSSLNVDETNRLLEGMREEAAAVVEAGAPGQPLAQTQTAFMRYLGQGHEVGVEIPVIVKKTPLDESAGETLRAAFEREYHRLYERTIPGVEVEILTWTLLVSTLRDPPAPVASQPDSYVPVPVGQRQLIDAESGQFDEAPCYDRSSLEAGATISGPAVIVEHDTATVVSAQYSAVIHTSGYIVLERKT
ncbi:MAG TPA: hydantoinase/oxoprolinase family protein, partial [Gammaproteobacteria bacterium]|nr:hydantoinase/oxoprolinase family protein [Gammaproteobacteria bacterium]